MKPSPETMKPDPEPCSTCGRRRRFGKKSWNPGGSRWLLSPRSTCWERMNTTAGFTCSATATNASDQSLALETRYGERRRVRRGHEYRLRRPAPLRQVERRRERQAEDEGDRHQSSELQPIPRAYR